MGEGLLNFYRTKLKKEYKIAFVSTFVIAMLIHIYKFTNTLLNHDSLYNYYSDQNMLGSGRWALSAACGISSYYDLPWINGLLSCVFIALTVVVIVALFKLENPVLIGLVGALIVSAPGITQTFFYIFTADGYMIAMLLAALAVYFSRIEEKRKGMWLLSGVCVCVSCGIYQAYVSFALILAICYFIDVLLCDTYDKKECFKWILRQAIIYILSLAAYYAIWKICMHFSGTAANDYLGISQVGKISMGLLVHGLKESVVNVIIYFLQCNVFDHGLTFYGVLSILELTVLAVGLVIACVKSGIFKRKWAFILLVLCLVAIIPFACIWNFTSSELSYRSMMLQSLSLLFVLTALLYEKWARTTAKNAVCLFLVMIVFSYAVMTNISYYYLNMNNERTYADGVEMMVEIHNMQDEYEFDKIAVVGRAENAVYEDIDPETNKLQPVGRVNSFLGLSKNTLMYDSDHVILYLEATFGLDLEVVDREERNRLLDTDEVRNMNSWPSDGSLKVIDGTLVLKLSDTKER